MTNTATPVWEKCFLCQIDRQNEPLKCPANDNKVKSCKEDEDKKLKLKETYTNIIENVFRLHELNSLPSDIVVTQFGLNVNAIVFLMLENKVYWHKKCRSNVDNQKIVRAKTAKRKDGAQEQLSKKLRSSDFTDINANERVCFLCGQGGKTLYKASTFGIDYKVKSCANIIFKEKLIGELSAGDMMAKNMEYHLDCLVKLYREAAACMAKEKEEDYPEAVIKAQAYSELIEYIESHRVSRSVLSMGQLYNLYISRLTSLGLNEVSIHRTRFRQQIISAIPDLIAVKNKSGQYDLVYDEDLSRAIAEYKTSTHDDIIILAKAARILRKA